MFLQEGGEGIFNKLFMKRGLLNWLRDIKFFLTSISYVIDTSSIFDGEHLNIVARDIKCFFLAVKTGHKYNKDKLSISSARTKKKGEEMKRNRRKDTDQGILPQVHM